MKTTIDSAGRVVIPKSVRQAVGITNSQEVEVFATNGRIEIETPSSSMHLEHKGEGVVAVPDQPLPTLKADEVREALESLRR